MRLQPKREASIEAQKQKKAAIDEGVELAKKVDALRATLATEEGNLQKFRTHATQDIAREIDLLLVRKNQLTKECELLAEERIKFLMPVDLKVEWEKVHDLEKEIAAWRADLINREATLIEKESSVEARESEFVHREEQIKEDAALTQQYLTKAQENYDASEQEKEVAQKLKADAEKDIKDTRKSLRLKAQELDERELWLNEKAKELSDKERDLEKEKLHIAAQQKTLKNAWEQIRTLQANKTT